MDASEKTGEVTLRLRKELYPEEIVDTAIAEVGKNIEVKKEGKEEYFEITLKPRNKKEAENIAFEFSSYVLSLIKKSPI